MSSTYGEMLKLSLFGQSHGTAMPTVPRNRPMIPPMIPFSTLPLDTLVIMDSPNTASAKYSGLEIAALRETMYTPLHVKKMIVLSFLPVSLMDTPAERPLPQSFPTTIPDPQITVI